MRKVLCHSLIVILGITAVLASPALGGDLSKRFTMTWQTRHAGHIKMWWTVGGIRDPHPFIDSDIVPPPGGTYEYHNIAPRDDINDLHEQWTLDKNTKKSSTNAVTDPGYSHANFYDFLQAEGIQSVTYFGLGDEAGLSDVEVNVDLTLWVEHLRHHPMPDYEAVYLFDATGQCPELPGYEAFDETAGGPFMGGMEVVSQTEIALPEPMTLALLGLGGAALLWRRR